jgi:hypothetical protein
MTAILTKPVWNFEYETQLLDRLVTEYAPNLPIVDRSETRPPQTPEEIRNIGQYRVFAAAHDLFIVQAIAKAIGSIIDDLHWQDLSYLLDIPVDQLSPLVSVKD